MQVWDHDVIPPCTTSKLSYILLAKIQIRSQRRTYKADLRLKGRDNQMRLQLYFKPWMQLKQRLLVEVSTMRACESGWNLSTGRGPQP